MGEKKYTAKRRDFYEVEVEMRKKNSSLNPAPPPKNGFQS
jgi:hypothetical protein